MHERKSQALQLQGFLVTITIILLSVLQDPPLIFNWLWESVAAFRGKAANYVGGEQPPFQVSADLLNNDAEFAAAVMEYLRTLVSDNQTTRFCLHYVESQLYKVQVNTEINLHSFCLKKSQPEHLSLILILSIVSLQ